MTCWVIVLRAKLSPRESLKSQNLYNKPEKHKVRMRNFTETLGQVLHCATAVLLVVRLNFAIMKVMWWANSLQMSPLMIRFKNYADKSSNSLETKSLASLRHGKKADIRVYVGEKLNSRRFFKKCCLLAESRQPTKVQQHVADAAARAYKLSTY